jgi:dTDP-4-amino-4,6-dideoxygalactose transaminase
MVYYQKPMPLFDALKYLGHREDDLPVHENACRKVVSLLFHPYLQTGDQQKVINCICQL